MTTVRVYLVQVRADTRLIIKPTGALITVFGGVILATMKAKVKP